MISSSHYKTIALIVAGGRGSRLGASLPKQYLELGGSPVLTPTIGAFLNHPQIDAVRVVIGTGDEPLYAQCIAAFSSPKLLAPVTGGVERHHSVRLGLSSLEGFSPHSVLIHDGARPYVSQALISRVLEGLTHYKGAVPGLAVTDTKKRAINGIIESTVDRSNLYKVQTPQGFDYLTILAAHRTFGNGPSFTDDASLLEQLGIPVKIVAGEPENIKITTREDMEKMQNPTLPSSKGIDIRVGHGIDVHALEPGNGVTLLGIFIPADFSLIGHSDADVGLHSLTDALLGAIGDGDIGHHFNPKDDRWKGCDSAVFLKDATRRVREKGGRINHVDVTLMGERPKIAPWRTQMIAKVAEILEIDTSRVSVKATTTEKLGFIGREEGLAAFATATVVF